MAKNLELKKKPLRRFRVYTHNENFGPFVYVCVWRTKQELWEHRPDIAKDSPGFNAVFCGYERRLYTKDGGEIIAPDFGELNFHLDSLRMGVITHEVTHAALAWCRINKLDPRKHGEDETVIASNSPEERFAWVMGNLARKVCLGVEDLLDYTPKQHECNTGGSNTADNKN